MKKRILFTGGGSAGHVTVNLALIPYFIEEGWQVEYIGSKTGIEKQLISNLPQVKYHDISTGKLRRYFDWQNFKDPLRVIKGVLQAYNIIRKYKPHVIFSKGGFVSVPVILGGWLNRVPSIIHESDLTPGLANRISIPFASKVLVTFPETKEHLSTQKVEYIGAIVRKELKEGDGERGRRFCNFTKDKPVLLVMGGSLGSQRINQVIRRNLKTLLSQFQIVHICGKGEIDPSIDAKGYKQFEYLDRELPDVLAMSDLIVSRAGSNAIFEFLSLRKPMLLIPLSKAASRGDQILNAQSFAHAGYSKVLYDEELNDQNLLNGISDLYKNRLEFVEKMNRSGEDEAIAKVLRLIREVAK